MGEDEEEGEGEGKEEGEVLLAVSVTALLVLARGRECGGDGDWLREEREEGAVLGRFEVVYLLRRMVVAATFFLLPLPSCFPPLSFFPLALSLRAVLRIWDGETLFPFKTFSRNTFQSCTLSRSKFAWALSEYMAMVLMSRS